MNSKVMSLGCLGIFCVSPSIAQAPPQTSKVVMKTNLGSFKITSPGDQNAYGQVKMSFKGSCLIVDYDNSTPLIASPGLRVEYQNKQRNRVVYFGEGTITLHGRFRAIQWFGRNLNMEWIGLGICRVYGEFDKNNNTGTFQIDNQKPVDWGSGGLQFSIPSRETSEAPPKVKINGGG